MVLRKTDLSALSQVRAALNTSTGSSSKGEAALIATNFRGRQVLTAHASSQPLDWTVFVESPIDEAFGPIYDSLVRTAVLMAVGLVLAVIVGLLLARRITGPIRALQQGGLVPQKFRIPISFTLPPFQTREGFSRLASNVCVVDCRSH